MNPSLFSNPVFKEAIADIEALGIKVSAQPAQDAMPYVVIGGRTNARWWLVPLENDRVTASGLALFQPLLSSARLMKALAVGLSRLGLSRLWARNIIYISGESALQQFFTHAKPLSFAYFTGTNSPHRKLAVQVMDSAGNIKGYAKVSRNPAVQALLQHEANTLNYVKTLNLQTANTPNVLFSGALSNACALVTDTLKTPKTKSVTKLQQIHLDFLQELADKTKADVQNKPDWLVDSLRNRFKLLENRLTPEWKARLEKAIAVVEQQKEDIGQPVMAHGDFTPWNTFVADGKLYVFDWEYFEQNLFFGYDLIQFVFSNIKNRHLPIPQINQALKKKLIKYKVANDDKSAITVLILFLCFHALMYLAREINSSSSANEWDDRVVAKLIESCISERN